MPTVFDTRFCAQTKFQGSLNIKLRADLVIFANDFYATGNFQITSADGNQHQVWVIVPDPDTTPNGVAECGKIVGANKSGNIKFDSGSIAIAPDHVLRVHALHARDEQHDDLLRTALRRQRGAAKLDDHALRPDRHPPRREPAQHQPDRQLGFRVDVVYKREVRNP